MSNRNICSRFSHLTWTDISTTQEMMNNEQLISLERLSKWSILSNVNQHSMMEGRSLSQSSKLSNKHLLFPLSSSSYYAHTGEIQCCAFFLLRPKRLLRPKQIHRDKESTSILLKSNISFYNFYNFNFLVWRRLIISRPFLEPMFVFRLLSTM